MKISDMIKILSDELEVRGDVEVQLHGCYGATSDIFEVMQDMSVVKEDRDKLNIWTDIMTG